MRIAVTEIDSRTNMRRLIHSIAAKYQITSDPVYTTRNGREYLMLGVRKRG